MARGHRTQIKRERNANKDTRPSAKLSYARVLYRKHASYWMPSEAKTLRQHWLSWNTIPDMHPA